jgi:hypothetical protein
LVVEKRAQKREIMEKIVESTESRLVVELRPWWRLEFLYGLPTMGVVFLVLVYLSQFAVSWYRYVLAGIGVWTLIGAIAIAYDAVVNTIWEFDVDRGDDWFRWQFLLFYQSLS